MVSGSGGLVLRAATALDPERADWIVVPGASGPLRGDDLDATASSDIAEGTNGASEESAPPIPVLLGGHVVTHHLGMDVPDLPLEEVEGQVEAGGDAACAGQVTVVDDAGVHRPGSG